jgi:hypothetical protein
MLPRLTLALIGLATAIAIAACSSVGSNNTISVGPNFPTLTLYATNSNQNAVSIYLKDQTTATGPKYQIGGSNTGLNGPQYLAFDSVDNLWVTNYNPSTNTGTLVEIAALATGNVVPLVSTGLSGRARGIAITPNTSPSPSASPQALLMVVTEVNPTAY